MSPTATQLASPDAITRAPRRRSALNIVIGAGMAAWAVGVVAYAAAAGPGATRALETGRLIGAGVAMLFLGPIGVRTLLFGLRPIHRGPERLHPHAALVLAPILGLAGLGFVTLPAVGAVAVGLGLLCGASLLAYRGIRALLAGDVAGH